MLYEGTVELKILLMLNIRYFEQQSNIYVLSPTNDTVASQLPCSSIQNVFIQSHSQSTPSETIILCRTIILVLFLLLKRHVYCMILLKLLAHVASPVPLCVYGRAIHPANAAPFIHYSNA